MAIVKNPFLSGEASGSVGSLCARRWKGIPTMCLKPYPVKRSRGKQSSNRAILGMLSRKWGLISQAVRDQFIAWAADHPEKNALGDTFIMTGLQCFIKLQHVQWRLWTASGLTLTPPTSELAYSVTDFLAASGAGAGQINLTWEVYDDGDALDLVEIQLAGPFVSEAKDVVFNRFKFHHSVAGNLEEYMLVSLVHDMWYWIRARYVGADGQVSEWQYAKQTPGVIV